MSIGFLYFFAIFLIFLFYTQINRFLKANPIKINLFIGFAFPFSK